MFDYIIIAFYILSLAYGWRKGALKIIYKLFSLFLSFYLTKLLYPVVSEFFRSMNVEQFISSSIKNTVNIDASDGLNVFEKRNFIEGLNLPDSVSNYIIENNNVETYSTLGVEKFNDYIVAILSSIVLNIVVAITLFLLIFITLRSIKVFLGFINKLPIVGEVNRGLGAIFQAILFTVYLCIFNVVLAISISFNGLDAVRQFVKGSFFGNYEFISDKVIGFILNFLG